MTSRSAANVALRCKYIPRTSHSYEAESSAIELDGLSDVFAEGDAKPTKTLRAQSTK